MSDDASGCVTAAAAAAEVNIIADLDSFDVRNMMSVQTAICQ